MSGYELKRAHSLWEQLRQVKDFRKKLYSIIRPGAGAEKLEVEKFIVFEKKNDLSDSFDLNGGGGMLFRMWYIRLTVSLLMVGGAGEGVVNHEIVCI